MAGSPDEEKESLTVQVPKSLMTELDRVAGGAGISRSDLVRMTLSSGLPAVSRRLKVRTA